MMMKTSLCSGILHWHRGSTGAVMTRGKDMVIIRTEDNKKADKDSRQELVYPGEIMQKVCQNWADWRSVQGSSSPANEPDLCPPSNLCFSSWCRRFPDVVGYVAPPTPPQAFWQSVLPDGEGWVCVTHHSQDFMTVLQPKNARHSQFKMQVFLKSTRVW